ncbi:hypothetical protein ACTWPT_41190 [Nonomuraea sp. 3N208]|uniref:hypothetical protein n=1 Tax=Nonomuraea sp. 3N208 TaxID=3457421 RepID=UPI003FD44AA7
MSARDGLRPASGRHAGIVAQNARELLGRYRELTARINQLEKHLKLLVQSMAPQFPARPRHADPFTVPLASRDLPFSGLRLRVVGSTHNGHDSAPRHPRVVRSRP